MSKTPDTLKYTASHEWVREESDGTVTVGITDHAQGLLGDVVYVELPELKKNLAAGDVCAVVESVKAAADVYSPISGEVIAVNESLATQPEQMNTDPYQDGWLCRIQIKDPNELGKLLTAQGYEQTIADDH